MNTRTIETIQRAGAALFEAQQLLAADLQKQNAKVVESLASRAFGIEPDHEFENWKALARIAQSLATMEEHLKKVYATAVGLHVGTPVANVLSIGFQKQPHAAGEVIDMPVPKLSRKPRSARARPASRPAADLDVASPSPGKKALALRGNAAQVFEYLVGAVDADGLIHATHANIHSATKVPLGSLNFSIATLKSKGRIEEVGRGLYRLSPMN